MAKIHIQWKGTDVCLDFICTCGLRCHIDGDFIYYIECSKCGKVWKMPQDFFEITEVVAEEIKGPKPFLAKKRE